MSVVRWWNELNITVDDYVPPEYDAVRSVDSNHNLLASLRNNEFDKGDAEYQKGFAILAAVFVCSGVLACIIIPLICVCTAKSRREYLEERFYGNEGTARHRRSGLAALIVSILAIGAVIGAVYGIAKTDVGLEKIANQVQEVSDDCEEALVIVDETNATMTRLATAYDRLRGNLSTCQALQVSNASLDSVVQLDDFIAETQAQLDNVRNSNLQGLSDNVADAAATVRKTEGIRKGVIWPILGVSFIIVGVFIVSGLGAYGLVSREIRCGICTKMTGCVRPGIVVVAVVIWLVATATICISALSGDFCIDPTENVRRIIGSGQLVQYYTGDCTSANAVVDSIDEAQIQFEEGAQDFMPSLYALVSLCPTVDYNVARFEVEAQEEWRLLKELKAVVSCRNINGIYTEAVYTGLCTRLARGLYALWVSSVGLTVFLLTLACLWTYLLKSKEIEKENRVDDPEWAADKSSGGSSEVGSITKTNSGPKDTDTLVRSSDRAPVSGD